MIKSFTPKVAAKKARNTKRKSTSKVTSDKARDSHRKSAAKVAAQEPLDTDRKAASKAFAEKVRDTQGKTAAQFEELARYKGLLEFADRGQFREPQIDRVLVAVVGLSARSVEEVPHV